MGADIHGNVTIKDDDGLVVLDGDGSERVRVGTRSVVKPPTDAEYPLLDWQGVSLWSDSPEAIIWSGELPLARRDGASGFPLADGQSIGGSLVYTLKDRNGVSGQVDMAGPVLRTKLSLRTATEVLAECEEEEELPRGAELDSYVVLRIEDTAVGRYMCSGTQTCFLYVELTIAGISQDNFSLFGQSGCSASMGVGDFYARVVQTKTAIAPNGICVNAGANRHILMDVDGIVLRWGNNGLRINDSGISKMVNGVWSQL